MRLDRQRKETIELMILVKRVHDDAVAAGMPVDRVDESFGHLPFRHAEQTLLFGDRRARGKAMARLRRGVKSFIRLYSACTAALEIETALFIGRTSA